MKSLSCYIVMSFFLFSSVFQSAAFPKSKISMPDSIGNDRVDTISADAQVFSFSDLGVKDQIQLRGPYQEYSIKFALPPDWQVGGEVELKLNVTSDFHSLLEAFTTEDPTEVYSFKNGLLRAELNGNSIGELEIRSSENQTVTFTAPGTLINQDTRGNELVISWDAKIACDNSSTSVIYISPESEIIFPHSIHEISLQLKDFPAPFLNNNNFISYPVAFVIPDQPDEDILSALMTVSSAFGKLEGKDFAYEIISAAELDQKKFEDHHFVFIGNFEQVNEMLAGKMGGDELDAPDAVIGTDNGFLTYQISPWNLGRIIFIVSGENGLALIKASSVISADSIIPYLNGNSAIIQDVDDSSAARQFQIDLPLGELVAEESLQVSSIDETLVRVPFSIPGDQKISPESYLELYFRHSQLINYLQSNITIFINNKLIGTIRLSDHSAENGLVRVILPPNVLQPLKNEMLISFMVTPYDICADERSQNYWVTIFGNSYFHLPPVLETVAESQPYTFENLSMGLMRNGSFSNLVFLVDDKVKQDWEYASRLAYTLGRHTDANIIQPAVRFANPARELENNKDYILISKIDKVPYFGEINKYLPLPINADGQFPRESFAGITFEIDSRQDIGVIESASIQDKQITILGAFGNSSKGLGAAIDTLIARITSGEKANANVEIIDGESRSHFYQFEPEKVVGGEGAAGKGGWFERFSGLALQKSAFFLLIIFVVISIGFIIWAIRNKTINK